MGENAEVYQQIREILQLTARIDERTKKYDEDQKDHEKRIRDLETERDKRNGAIATIAAFSSIIGGAIVLLFNWLFPKGGVQ